MSWKTKLLTLALGLVLVSGLGVMPSAVTAQVAPQAAPVAAKPVTSTAPVAAVPASKADPIYSYQLGAGDQIRLIVFGEVALSGNFTINGEGKLSLPLIGEIAAAGLTASQVQEKIETALLEGYLKDPKVNVEVLTFRPYYIYGEVIKPGEYPYSNGMTIDKAVATASGYTYRADKKRAYVKHASEEKESPVELKEQVLVKPGDTIRIGERYF
jgi:protein involved in polysaccharide export with SLBB domain